MATTAAASSGHPTVESDSGRREDSGTRLHCVGYEPTGTVTTFRLDSENWQTVWGRIYIDACVPEGTSISVYTVTSDEPPTS